jgi:hypothetical protein
VNAEYKTYNPSNRKPSAKTASATTARVNFVIDSV